MITKGKKSQNGQGIQVTGNQDSSKMGKN